MIRVAIAQPRVFDSRHITAMIVSRQTFKINPIKSYLVEVRASLTNWHGMTPYIFLYGEYGNNNPEHFKIPIVTFNGILLDGLAHNSTEYLTSGYNFRELHKYQIIYHDNSFTWLRNGTIIATSINLWNKKDSSNFQDNAFEYKLIISLAVAENKIPKGYLPGVCDAIIIIDYIKVYQYNHSEFNYGNKIDSTEYQGNFADVCDNVHKDIYPPEKFTKNNTSKLLFNDEFDGDSLNENKWLIQANQSICERKF